MRTYKPSYNKTNSCKFSNLFSFLHNLQVEQLNVKNIVTHSKISLFSCKMQVLATLIYHNEPQANSSNKNFKKFWWIARHLCGIWNVPALQTFISLYHCLAAQLACWARHLQWLCSSSDNLMWQSTLDMISLAIFQKFLTAPPPCLLSLFHPWPHDLPVNQLASITSLLSHPLNNQCQALGPCFYPGFNFGLHEMLNT